MIKRDCLLDLIEFFDSDDSQYEPGEKLDKETREGQENLKKLRPLVLANEVVMQAVFKMIWLNLIRTPKVQATKGKQVGDESFSDKGEIAGDFDDRIMIEESWPHI
jgi:hypothetical protein